VTGDGTIDRACSIFASLLRGGVFERNGLAQAHGMTVAAADRYIRALGQVPGVVTRKVGRKLLVSFSFGDALKLVGR
jgi:hypothetical protein